MSQRERERASSSTLTPSSIISERKEVETSNHEWLTHVSSSTFTRVMVLEKDNVTLEHRDLSMT